MKIYVAAQIQVNFDFDSSILKYGVMDLIEPISKNAVFLIRDPVNTQITEITTSSEYITARQLPLSEEDDGSKIEIEITANPGLPLGEMREVVTAHSNLEDKPNAVLRLTGMVRGEVETIPVTLRFDRYPIKGELTSKFQTLQVINRTPEKDIHVLSAEDPEGRLNLEVKTLEEGREYEIDAALNEDVLGDGTHFRGLIQITTDNPTQKTVRIVYNIYCQK